MLLCQHGQCQVPGAGLLGADQGWALAPLLGRVQSCLLGSQMSQFGLSGGVAQLAAHLEAALRQEGEGEGSSSINHSVVEVSSAVSVRYCL